MHIIDSLWLFVLVTMASVATPGPAVLLALRNGGTYGAKSALWSSLGNVLGLMIISAVSAWGLSALLMTSSWLFVLVKIIGGLYLAYIGSKLLFPHFFQRHSKTKLLSQESEVGQVDQIHEVAQVDVSNIENSFDSTLAIQKTSPSAYKLTRQGLLIALSNPKAIFFFSALFPQFLNPYDALALQFVVLTSVFMLISFSGLMIYAFIASSTRVVLGASHIALWLKRFAGLLFLGMAIMLLGWKPGDGR